jgi:FG-GAP-like repeat
VGDFNGDGKADVITANFAELGDTRHVYLLESDLRLFLGNGDGTFQPAQVVTFPDDYAPGSIVWSRSRGLRSRTSGG